MGPCDTRCRHGASIHTSELASPPGTLISSAAPYHDTDMRDRPSEHHDPFHRLHQLFSSHGISLTTSWRSHLVGCLLVVASAACEPRQFATVVIYNSPHSFVRLEADPTAEGDRRHAHPATLTPEQ